MKFSKSFLDKVLKGLELTLTKGGMLFARDGKLFASFDEIRVRQQDASTVVVEIFFRGSPVLTLRENMNFAAGQTFTLAGIEGATEIVSS